MILTALKSNNKESSSFQCTQIANFSSYVILFGLSRMSTLLNDGRDRHSA